MVNSLSLTSLLVLYFGGPPSLRSGSSGGRKCKLITKSSFLAGAGRSRCTRIPTIPRMLISAELYCRLIISIVIGKAKC